VCYVSVERRLEVTGFSFSITWRLIEERASRRWREAVLEVRERERENRELRFERRNRSSFFIIATFGEVA
jgi:hypothetical protein